MGYVADFKALASTLRAHKDVVVTELKINKPASPRKLEAAKGQLWPLPKPMRAFYEEANGVVLKWRARDKGLADEVAGSINLLPIESVFGDWEDTIWFADMPRFKNILPFDFFEPEACAALELRRGQKPRIVFHYCGENTDRMRVDDFGEYLKLLFEARGFRYWQTAALAKRSTPWESARTFREWMPKLGFDAPRLIDAKTRKKDQSRSNKESKLEAKTRKHFEKHGVSFQSKGTRGGYVTFAIDWKPANLRKAGRALTEAFDQPCSIPLKCHSVSIGQVTIEHA